MRYSNRRSDLALIKRKFSSFPNSLKKEFFNKKKYKKNGFGNPISAGTPGKTRPKGLLNPILLSNRANLLK